MNFAHLHLMINHFALFIIPLAIIFYSYALINKNEDTKNFAFKILIIGVFCVIPTFFSGDFSEDIVENMAGINKHYIEEHEESAKIAMILAVIGTLASAAWFISKSEKTKQKLEKTVLLISLGLVLVLAYTANQGGRIHHSEIDGGEKINVQKELVPGQETEVFQEDESE